MKADKKLNEFAELFLAKFDSFAYRLSSYGFDNEINRHNLIALIMFGQKRLEGEIDSLSAKVDTGKAKVEDVSEAAEKLFMSGLSLAVFPAKYTYNRLKSKR